MYQSRLVARTSLLALPTDSISRFGVSRIPRARLHRHGLSVIIRLGERVGECWSALDTEAFSRSHAGFVSYAHRDPRLRPEEPRRLLLDLLDGNAVRKSVVARFE